MAHSGVFYTSERRRGPKRREARNSLLPLTHLLDGPEKVSG